MDNDKLRLKDLVDYLKHPLQLKAERVFGKSNDDDEKLEQEYEPFDLDNLKQWEINSIIANEALQKNALDDATCAIDIKALDSIKRRCALFNVLPRTNDNYVNDPVFNKSFNDCVDLISTLFIAFFELFGHKPSLANILKMDGEIKINNHIVSINKSDVLLEINGNRLSFMEIKKLADNPDLYNFYSLYIVSLFYVLLKDNDILYSVELIKGSTNGATKRFDINSKIAKQYLEKIVAAITSQIECYQFIPVMKIKDQLEALDNINEKELLTYYEILIEASNQHGNGKTWSNFIDARLFNDIKNLGYSNIDNFDDEYREALKKYKELIIPLLPKRIEIKDYNTKDGNNGF